MEWRESTWQWIGWGGRQGEHSLRWSMRKMSTKLWRSTGSISVHATLRVCLHQRQLGMLQWENLVCVKKKIYRASYVFSSLCFAVYEVTESDAEAIIKKATEAPAGDGVVRLRGLPFSSTEADIAQFFSGSWHNLLLCWPLLIDRHLIIYSRKLKNIFFLYSFRFGHRRKRHHHRHRPCRKELWGSFCSVFLQRSSRESSAERPRDHGRQVGWTQMTEMQLCHVWPSGSA